MLRSFLKHLPLAGTIMIILGVVKLSVYYSFFSIPILIYLDLSECIFLFLDGVMLISLLAVISFFGGIYFAKRQLTKEKEKRYSMAPEELYLSIKNKKKDLLLVANISTVVGLLFAAIISFIGFSQYPFFRAVHFIISKSFPLIFMIGIRPLADFSKKVAPSAEPQSETLRDWTVMGIAYLITIVGWTVFNAYSVKYQKSQPFTALTKEGQQISANDSLIYVGRTKNYIFMYDRKAGQSEIYSNDDIRMVKY